jgi:hypothetical protein
MYLGKNFKIVAIAIAALAFAQIAYSQTAGDGKIANMSVGVGSVRWDITVPNAGGALTITFPDGRSIKKGFRSGAAPEIDLSDKQLDGLPDGVYSYELRLAPALTAGQKDTIMKARGSEDDSEAERNLRKRPVVPALVQAGSFALVNGSIIGPGGFEGERTASNSTQQPQTKAQPATPARVSANTITRLRNHRFSLAARPDDVIADDLIVQGSACVGLDCVNGEVFGFDTVRLKENNTRLQFNDTSTSAGFPTNNWQIRANDSGSGGASFLGFVDQGSTGDSETGTIVFRVDAGAPANSLKVSSSGKVGIGTGSPVLLIHETSTDTPAVRMEQTNGGGFTAQTWDLGANEANWFVRDVTGGSRLPFRIRPGAPTSSIDISATGDVGVGTASPAAALHVLGTNNADMSSILQNTTGADSRSVAFIASVKNAAGTQSDVSMEATAVTGANANLAFRTGGSGTGFGTQRMIITGTGNVGIGTTTPDQKLSVSGDADKSAGGTSWGVFSDERLKNIKGSYTRGLHAVMGLRPVRFSYKSDNPLALPSNTENIGFSAQALQKVVPEAVTRNANGYLTMHSDPILWAMVNAIQEQQREITSLKAEVQKLRRTPRRHRK